MKYKSNCVTCQKSKGNPKLRNRIRYAAYKREQGDETLSDIAADINVGVPSIYNHVKKHMQDFAGSWEAAKETKVAKKVVELRATAQKELETAIEGDVLDAVEARTQEVIALDDYIAQGKAVIDKGELKITAQSFLAAVKIRSDIRSKEASNKLDYMKTIYALSSGAKKEIDKDNQEALNDGTGSSREVAAVDTGRENGPDTVYREAAGAEAA